MYIITCGNENDIVMEPETGYVPNNPLFGLPSTQLDKVSRRSEKLPPHKYAVQSRYPLVRRATASDHRFWSFNSRQIFAESCSQRPEN